MRSKSNEIYDRWKEYNNPSVIEMCKDVIFAQETPRTAEIYNNVVTYLTVQFTVKRYSLSTGFRE